jgi:hypothetical protein
MASGNGVISSKNVKQGHHLPGQWIDAGDSWSLMLITVETTPRKIIERRAPFRSVISLPVLSGNFGHVLANGYV